MNYSLHCRSLYCTHSIIHTPSNLNRLQFLLPSSIHRHPIPPRTLPLLVSAVSSPQKQSRKGGKSNKTTNKDNVHLHLRLDHQVQFGEHVALLGSSKQFGSWKTNVPFNWTPNGWVCDFHFNGGENLEFKFIIVNQHGTLLWESGDNRVLNLPQSGNFHTVAKWNTTHQAMDLLPLDQQEQHRDHDSENVGDNSKSNVDKEASSSSSSFEAGSSPFVGEWQGKSISFMQSNEHHSNEAQRTWDTSGLQGLPLKFVQGDQTARNWWRKVISRACFSKLNTLAQ